jgi:hypothetical protein
LLLDKLDKLGIRGTPHKLIKSYLKNRTQIVQIGNSFSTPEVLSCSVPQGSVIGALLFLIYVNDLPLFVNNGKLTQFVDDITYLLKNKSLNNLSQQANTDIESMCDWFYVNGLVLNTTKTVIMNFNIPHDDFNDIANTFKIPLNPVTQTKFLGITIESNLGWIAHIDNVAVKLARACYCIKKIKILANKSTSKIYYFSNFHSVMVYGIVCWGCVTEAKRIFILQKRAIRLITGNASRAHCRELFKEESILPFPCVYIFETLLHAFRNKSNFNLLGASHEYNTRKGNNTLSVPIHRTALFEKSPNYMAVKLFNKLPDTFKEIKKIGTFKKKLKAFLMDKCFYDVKEFLESK